MNACRTEALVRRAVVEARIRKWFKGKHAKKAPSKLLGEILRPKKGIHVKLDRYERDHFIELIRRMYATRKIIEKYRRKYGRRPKLFYQKVFGFTPRPSQTLSIIWNTSHVHFIFDKNDLISFWKRVQWGPGSGGYYSVGDRDIKIKELRGLISFGRRECYSIETNDIIRHESVHSFEDFVKRRKPPYSRERYLFYKIKCELNASLKNFKEAKGIKKRRVNEWARIGLGLEVRDEVNSYLGFDETIKGIKNMKVKVRKAKSKKEKKKLNNNLDKLKRRLELKKIRRRHYFSLYRKTVNQVKKAVEVMPIFVLQRIVYETPFERLYKKIPETVTVYKRMKNDWYKKFM